MQKLQRIYQFIFVSPFYDFRIWTASLRSLLFETRPTTVRTLTEEEVIQNIISGKSIIRLGDGEMMILVGRDVYFQPSNKRLASVMRNIITSYSKESPYILGIPHEKISAPHLDKEQHRLWRLYRICFPLSFKINEMYASPILFYQINFFKKKIEPLLEGFHVIWVANETAITGLRDYAETVGKKSSFVQIPQTNAFQEYDQIMEEILLTIQSTTLPAIVLCSGGPAIKMLIYELTMMGIQGLDIGHGMQVIIENKDRTWIY